MTAYKKLTFKQALIALGHGEEIRSEPDVTGKFMTISVNSKDRVILRNTGYMEIDEMPDQQWYVGLDVYQKLFVGKEVDCW